MLLSQDNTVGGSASPVSCGRLGVSAEQLKGYSTLLIARF